MPSVVDHFGPRGEAGGGVGGVGGGVVVVVGVGLVGGVVGPNPTLPYPTVPSPPSPPLPSRPLTYQRLGTLFGGRAEGSLYSPRKGGHVYVEVRVHLRHHTLKRQEGTNE